MKKYVFFGTWICLSVILGLSLTQPTQNGPSKIGLYMVTAFLSLGFLVIPFILGLLEGFGSAKSAHTLRPKEIYEVGGHQEMGGVNIVALRKRGKKGWNFYMYDPDFHTVEDSNYVEAFKAGGSKNKVVLKPFPPGSTKDSKTTNRVRETRET